MRTNTGERSYKCHVGEKPYKCDICDNLAEHMQTHQIKKLQVCLLATSSANQAIFSKSIINQAFNSIIDSESISAKLPMQLSILNRLLSLK